MMAINCINGKYYDSNIYIINGVNPTIIDCGTGLYNEDILYDIKKRKVTLSGWIHNFYALIQAFLMITFIFSTIKSGLVYLQCSFLLIYLFSDFYSSKKIHGKIILSDWLFIIIGLILTIGKIVYTVI